MRTFLDMINFYRRYLKDAAKTQPPLHELLKRAKNCNIQHVLGKDNVVADALYGIESISGINFDAIAEELTRDEELQHNSCTAVL
ncbi:hypothetical protein TNCV_2625231 [Trichonephila clavipes]|nr:hypothetical protein TNCV_2625231 [Trichonephila clavipes]